MKQHDSPDEKEPVGEARRAGTSDAAPATEGAWLDAEILKVLMGADVELDQ
ncbi:hypothetical protein ACWDDN_14050 [Streptomyces griseoruber]